MNSEPVFSFCIRSLHPDVTEQEIRNSLSSIANISSIDFVNKNTKPTYSSNSNCFKMAFIHVESWHNLFTQQCLEEFIDDVCSSEGVKIYYNDYRYFVLRENLKPYYKREQKNDSDFYKDLFAEHEVLVRELEYQKEENWKLACMVDDLREELEKKEKKEKQIVHSNLDAKIPLKKRLKKNKKIQTEKQTENQKPNPIDNDLEEYLYITTDEEDNNIHMSITINDNN